MIRLIHQTLIVLDLVIELFLDVVLHLVGDQSTCDLICHLAQQSEIVGGKVLVSLLVGDLEDTDSMISKLDGNEEDVTDYLMQLLIHRHVFTKFLPNIFILRSLKVPSLPRVEHLAEDIWLITLTLEANRFTQSTCNDFAEQLVFDSIVKEDGAPFYIEQIR